MRCAILFAVDAPRYDNMVVDRQLVVFGKCLRRWCRSMSVVCRSGGSSFRESSGQRNKDERDDWGREEQMRCERKGKQACDTKKMEAQVQSRSGSTSSV